MKLKRKHRTKLAYVADKLVQFVQMQVKDGAEYDENDRYLLALQFVDVWEDKCLSHQKN